jgi:hypothetical protein
MKKTSTVRVNKNTIFKGHKLTIGMDLGDRWSCYCVLDEAGKIILEQKVAMTPEAMKQTFSKIPQGLIAMETGTHSRPFRKREGTRASLLEKSPESRTKTVQSSYGVEYALLFKREVYVCAC